MDRTWKRQFSDQGWTVTDGTLMAMPNRKETPVKGVDIVTTSKYSAFELNLNSILLRLKQWCEIFLRKWWVKRWSEYQVLDDKRHPDAKLGEGGDRTMGSLYDLIPAKKKNVLPNLPVNGISDELWCTPTTMLNIG